MLIRLQCYLHVYICTCVCPWWWKPWLKQVRRELNVIEFEWMEYVLNLKKTKNWFSHVSFTELEWFILDTSGDSLNISYSDFGFNRKTKCQHQRKKIRIKNSSRVLIWSCIQTQDLRVLQFCYIGETCNTDFKSSMTDWWFISYAWLGSVFTTSQICKFQDMHFLSSDHKIKYRYYFQHQKVWRTRALTMVK